MSVRAYASANSARPSTKTDAPTIPTHLTQRRQPRDHLPFGLPFWALFLGCLVCELTGDLFRTGADRSVRARRRRLPQMCPAGRGTTPQGRGVPRAGRTTHAVGETQVTPRAASRVCSRTIYRY